MRILRLRSGMGPDAVRKALDGLDAIAIRLGTAESVEEFGLASHLAKASFEKKKNIARSLRIEFLLWLSGRTDIRSAILETAPQEGDGEFFAAVFSDADTEAICRKLEAKKQPPGLKKNGEPLALERISLSRVRN